MGLGTFKSNAFHLILSSISLWLNEKICRAKGSSTTLGKKFDEDGLSTRQGQWHS